MVRGGELPNALMGNTEYALQQARIEREARHKFDERQTALTVLESYAEKHGWPPEDVETVIQALGLRDYIGAG